MKTIFSLAINIVDRNYKWLLSLLFILSLIQNICCKVISDADIINTNKPNKNDSLPKIITLQTYKDWSSRLDASNQTTPQTTTLLLQETKDFRTTSYATNENPYIVSTHATMGNMRESMGTTPKVEIFNTTKHNEINAHNYAANVLSKFVHVSPLLAMASNSIPSHEMGYNRSVHERSPITRSLKPMNYKQNLPLIETSNEIDTESNLDQIKTERKGASAISFPATDSYHLPPTTTTDNMYEMSTTEIPEEHSHEAEESDEHQEPTEHQESHQEEEEPVQHDHDHEDYEDDEELESLEYPVRVSFHDTDDEPVPDSDSPPSFLIPNIDLNPENLKQRGCRTVVKEVQAIPVENELEKNQSPVKNGIIRTKRSNDGNARRFTSIVMTKECHFPGDEETPQSSEEIPQKAVDTNKMSDSKRENTYQTPIPHHTYQTPAPQFAYPTPNPRLDEDDDDFDFRPRLSYPSMGLIEELETNPSNNRKKYTNNPIRESDNSDNPKHKHKSDYDFDDSRFYDFNDYLSHPSVKPQRSLRNQGHQIRSSPSNSHDFDDEDYGPPPKPKRKQRNHNTRNKQKRPPMYKDERDEREEREERGVRGGRRQRYRPKRPPMLKDQRKQKQKKEKKGKRKPKTINRSFAFFRKAEPKDKDPNESDFSVSYGRGNFQSFSQSYDSDKDGPRSPGQRRSSNYD